MGKIKIEKKKLLKILFLICIFIISIIWMFISGKMMVKASDIGEFNPGIYHKYVDSFGFSRYSKIAESTWKGKYQTEYYKTTSRPSLLKIVSYLDYSKEIKKINERLASTAGFEIPRISKKYHNPTCNYIVLEGYFRIEAELFSIRDVFIDGDEVVLICGEVSKKDMIKIAPDMAYFIAIPTDLPVTTQVTTRTVK